MLRKACEWFFCLFFQGLSTLLNFDDDFQLLQQASVSLVSTCYTPLSCQGRGVAPRLRSGLVTWMSGVLILLVSNKFGFQQVFSSNLFHDL